MKSLHLLLPPSTTFFLFFASVLQFTAAIYNNDGTTCKWTDPRGRTIDLSSMAKSGPNYYTHVQGSFLFHLNLCGEVDSSKCTNHDALGVQYIKNGMKCIAVLGSATKPPKSWANLQPPHDGYALTFAPGDGGCITAPFTRSMTYDMVCDNTIKEAQLLSVVENPTCVYTAIWKVNCNATSASGMTFAVKLCLFLGIGFLLYAGIFCYLERKESGEARLPEHHKEIFHEFITMAKEGCAFSYEKAYHFAENHGYTLPCGSPSGGNGGNSQQYDPVPTTEKGSDEYGSSSGNRLTGESPVDFGDENL
jgi:hypothetical protein